jgi:hypothetical protein
MKHIYAGLTKEAALYPEINLGSLEEQIKRLQARSEALAQERQQAHADIEMVKNQIGSVVQEVSTQADDIATRATTRLLAYIAVRAQGFGMMGLIFAPLLALATYMVYQHRWRRAIRRINASSDLGRLLEITTDNNRSYFVRKAAVDKIVGECFGDQTSLQKITQKCGFLGNRRHHNDLRIAGILAREAHEIERRINEDKSIL